MDITKFLLPRRPGTIRRFHGTDVSKLPDIYKQGLLPSDPGYGHGVGVYTSVHPDYFHDHMPRSSVIAVDIPKDYYKTASKLEHNPETPKRRYGMGTNERLLDPVDLYERFIIDTIKDKGRVDIFADRLRPEWFTDAAYVGPDKNIYRYSGSVPQEFELSNSDWLDIQPGSLEDDLLRKFITNDELLGRSELYNK